MRTQNGSYKFLTMPFGLCNMLVTFVSIIVCTFHEKMDEYVMIYINNILVYSKVLRTAKETFKGSWMRCESRCSQQMPKRVSAFHKSLSLWDVCWRKQGLSLTRRKSEQSKNIVGIRILIWVGSWVGGIVEGSWFQHKMFIFSSSFVTRESNIGWDTLESHIETIF